MEDEKLTEQQQLAWSQEIPNYGDKLLKRLDEFRKTTILYDVRVIANNGDFNAHKVILAACGGIFRSCFIDEKRKMISSTITELKLDCPAQGLRPIIRFAYTGALVVTKRNAIATMIAAEVTKMKEVQEICADIAIKEYSWIIRLDEEKKADMTEAIEKVLSLHAPYFTFEDENKKAENEKNYELPFLEEVKKSFPEYVATYEQLASHINWAKTLMKSSKLISDRNNMITNEPNADVDADKLSATSDELSKETTTEEKVSNKLAMLSVKENGKVIDENGTSTKPAESGHNVIHQPAPPLTKPRSSMKAKKTAPPPPHSPIAKQSSNQTPNKQPPPRPQKLPSKLPPPRPKAPVKKKALNDEDLSSKRNEDIEYDDSLNPFA